MAAPRRRLTPTQYLEIERAADYRSEFLNGEMFAMAGASFEHTRIKDNLAAACNSRFRGGPCLALTSDIRIKVQATGLYTYPDVAVICGGPEFEDSRRDTLLNPRVIVEVLSPSTEKYDRGAKFRHYQQIPSLMEYVLITQDEAVVERYMRGSEGTWILTTVTGLDGALTLASVPVTVPLAEIYEGVAFPEPGATPNEPPPGE